MHLSAHKFFYAFGGGFLLGVAFVLFVLSLTDSAGSSPRDSLPLKANLLNPGMVDIDAVTDMYIGGHQSCGDGTCGGSETWPDCPDDCTQSCTTDADCNPFDPSNQCLVGQCVAGKCEIDDRNVSCSGGVSENDPCTSGYCEPASGACVRETITCEPDVCGVSAQCVVGEDGRTTCQQRARDCSDGDPCTHDGCNPFQGGCYHTPLPCDDGDACTTDSCVDGACVFEPADSCPSCTNNADCDDGSACTVDYCTANGDCAARDIPCDDRKPCTIDWCDPNAGCMTMPDPECDDDDPPPSGCHDNPAKCDDRNRCTDDFCNCTAWKYVDGKKECAGSTCVNVRRKDCNI